MCLCTREIALETKPSLYTRMRWPHSQASTPYHVTAECRGYGSARVCAEATGARESVQRLRERASLCRGYGSARVCALFAEVQYA
jgi:hypothetical protein